MTGGVVYLRLDEAMGSTRTLSNRRLAKGADVRITEVDASDEKHIRELLSRYMMYLARMSKRRRPSRPARVLQDLADFISEGIPVKK
jgi:glutamate synthase (NADPH/NADH) large chain